MRTPNGPGPLSLSFRHFAAASVILTVVTSALAASVGPARAAAADAWTWPVVGDVITQYRNGEDPYAGGQHRGIDIAAPTGTPVAAAAAGTVRFRGTAGSSGLTVSIRTADGRFDTSYLHLSSVQVRKGDHVRLGQRVGAVGTSGSRRSAAAPHLHFGVRNAGSRHAYRNPLDFLPAPGTPPVRVAPPAPVPAPVRVGRSPEPVRSPQARRVPSRRRVRVPAGRRLPIPAGRRLPVPATRMRPLPRPSPFPLREPLPAPRAARRAPLPGGIPARGPAPAVAPNRAPDPAHDLGPESPPATHSHRATHPADGPDLGWALACAGLLLAAACIGRPGHRDAARRDAAGRHPAGGRKTAGEQRGASLAEVLRPLFGRR